MTLYPATLHQNETGPNGAKPDYLEKVLASLAGLRTLPNGDMTVRQLLLLLAVNIDGGPHTVRGLASRFPMGKSDATRALDRLEAAGLVKRGPDPLDRRSVTIHGTSVGRALVKKIENFAIKPTREKSPRRTVITASAVG